MSDLSCCAVIPLALSYRIDGNNVDLSTENVELAAEQINYNALIDSMNNELSV